MPKRRAPNRTATRKPVELDARSTPRTPPGRLGYRPQRLSSDPSMIARLLEHAEPHLILAMLPALIFLDHVAYRGAPGNVCLRAAHELRVVYIALGVPVEIKPVRLEVHGPRGGTAYGTDEPHFTNTGDFVGHCVLRFPTLDRFLDATVGQFPDVARRSGSPMLGRTVYAAQGTDPRSGPWPAGARFSTVRGDLELRYIALDPGYDQVLLDGAAASEEFRRATLHNGLNLLAQTITMLSTFDVAARKLRSANVPHLPVLLDAVQGAEWTPSPERADHFTRDDATIRLRDLVDLSAAGIEP